MISIIRPIVQAICPMQMSLIAAKTRLAMRAIQEVATSLETLWRWFGKTDANPFFAARPHTIETRVQNRLSCPYKMLSVDVSIMSPQRNGPEIAVPGQNNPMDEIGGKASEKRR
jgi:hypothetical protein